MDHHSAGVYVKLRWEMPKFLAAPKLHGFDALSPALRVVRGWGSPFLSNK